VLKTNSQSTHQEFYIQTKICIKSKFNSGGEENENTKQNQGNLKTS